MKTSAQKQFAKNPDRYRDEPLFSAGKDLEFMVNSVSLQGDEVLLDVGSGAGHTAIAFSPFVKHCTGVDITEEMVQTAALFAKEKNAFRVSFLQMRKSSIFPMLLLISLHAVLRPTISLTSAGPLRKSPAF
ncbi:putative methyltransferase YcgJ [Bacillus sonorensis]|uniref:Methyltransferase YcgJ n=1 Tax=Bacillus sonorensis TaxID=119858 RepID=A0ABN5ACV2_9BACI|nr:putative methyltransferase YcgJ [Bacillus sonorensis]